MKPQAVKYMLFAADMDRAVGFYRDTMGFDEGYVSPYWSELRFGDAILALHACDEKAENPTGLSLQYENVRLAHAAAIAAGAVSLQSPEQREGEPILLATIADPEGNVIMLTQIVGES
jgi:catechol 2,3-dioxygenase-like lactoylglutathione lyase family enzyme